MSVSLSSVYEQTEALRQIQQRLQQAINNQQSFEKIVEEIISQSSSLSISQSYRLMVLLSKFLTNNSSIRKKYVALYVAKKLFLTAYHHFYIFGSVRILVWLINMSKFQSRKNQHERVKSYTRQLSLKGNGDQVYQQRQCYRLFKFIQQFLPWFSQNIPTQINAQFQYRSTFARAYDQMPQQYKKNIPMANYENFSYNQYAKFEQNFNIRKSHNKQLIKQLTQFISLEANSVINQQKNKSQLLKQVIKTSDSYCIKSIISEICTLIQDKSKLFNCLKLTQYLMNVGEIQFIELTKLYIVPALMNYLLPVNFIQGKRLQRSMLNCSLTEEKCIIDNVCIWKKITENVGLSTKLYDQILKNILLQQQNRKQKLNLLNVQQQHIGQFLTNVIDMQKVNAQKKPHIQNQKVEQQLIKILNINKNPQQKQIKPMLISMQPNIQQLSNYNRNLNESAINQLSQFKQSMVSRGNKQSSSSSGGFAQLFAGKPQMIAIGSSQSESNIGSSNSRSRVTPKKGIYVQSNKNMSQNSPEPLLTFRDLQITENSQNPPNNQNPSRNSFAAIFGNNNYYIGPNMIASINQSQPTNTNNNNIQIQKNNPFKQSLQIYNNNNNNAINQNIQNNIMNNKINNNNNINNNMNNNTNINNNTNNNTNINNNNIANKYMADNRNINTNNTNRTSMQNVLAMQANTLQNNLSPNLSPIQKIKQQSFMQFNASQISKYSQYSNNLQKQNKNNTQNIQNIQNIQNTQNMQNIKNQIKNSDPLKKTSPDQNLNNRNQNSIHNSRSLKSITQKSSQMVYFGRSEQFISYHQSRNNINNPNNNSKSSSKIHNSSISSSNGHKSSILRKQNLPLVNKNDKQKQGNKQKPNQIQQQSTSTYKFDSSNISASSLSNSNIKNYGKIGQQFPETVPKPTFGFKKKQKQVPFDLINNVLYEKILGSQQLSPRQKKSPQRNYNHISNIIQNTNPARINQSQASQIQDLSGGKHNYNQSIRLSEASYQIQQENKRKLAFNKDYQNLYRNNNDKKILQNYTKAPPNNNNKYEGGGYNVNIMPQNQYYSNQLNYNYNNNQNANQNIKLIAKLNQQKQKLDKKYPQNNRELNNSKSENNLLADHQLRMMYQNQNNKISPHLNPRSPQNNLDAQNMHNQQPIIIHQIANDSYFLTLQQQLGRAMKQKAEKQEKLKQKQQQYKLMKSKSVPFMNRKMQILKKQDEIIKILQNKKNEQDYFHNRNNNDGNQGGILIKPIKQKNKITDFFLENQSRGAYIPIVQPFERIFIKQLLGSRCLLLSNQFIQLGYNYSQIKNQISLYLTLFKVFDKVIISVAQNSLILQKPINMQIQNQASGYQIKIKRKVKGIVQPLNYFNNQPKFQQIINFRNNPLYKFPQLTIKLLQNDNDNINNVNNLNGTNSQTSNQYLKFKIQIPCSMFTLSTPIEIDKKVIQKINNKKVLKSQPLPINPQFLKNHTQKIEKYFPSNMKMVGGWNLIGYKFPMDLLLKRNQSYDKSKSKSSPRQNYKFKQISNSNWINQNGVNNNQNSSSWSSVQPCNPASGQFRNQLTNQLEQYLKFKINGRTIQFELFNNPKSLLTETIVSMLVGKIKR